MQQITKDYLHGHSHNKDNHLFLIRIHDLGVLGDERGGESSRESETGKAYENGISADYVSSAVETPRRVKNLRPGENHSCSQYHFCCERKEQKLLARESEKSMWRERERERGIDGGKRYESGLGFSSRRPGPDCYHGSDLTG